LAPHLLRLAATLNAEEMQTNSSQIKHMNYWLNKQANYTNLLSTAPSRRKLWFNQTKLSRGLVFQVGPHKICYYSFVTCALSRRFRLTKHNSMVQGIFIIDIILFYRIPAIQVIKIKLINALAQ